MHRCQVIETFYRDSINGRGFTSHVLGTDDSFYPTIMSAPLFFEKIHALVSSSIDKQGKMWSLLLDRQENQRKLFYFPNKSIFLKIEFPTVVHFSASWALFDPDQFNYLAGIFPNLKTLIIHTNTNRPFHYNVNVVLYTMAQKKNIELYLK